MANIFTKFHRLLLKVFGSRNQRVLKELWPRVGGINVFEPEMRQLSDEQLAAKTAEFRDRLAHGETLNALLPEAFAAVREASYRNLKTPGGQPMRHFDVQLLGGIALHQGKIAEMATGEGKTLVATLPAYLNALEGRGVHIVTVNDYLAKRDRDWMAPIYQALGMKVGAIQNDMGSVERQQEYACDVTYGTNNEFGFDYLRDNMKILPQEQVQQRGRHYAIVDEVDSILIDEARTPLIISGQAERSTDKYYTANRVAKRMVRGRHFEVKEKERAVYFTEEGIDFAQRLVGVESFYIGKDMEWPHLIEQALRAHHLFNKDVDYVARDGEVVIVDEFTGRLMEGRTWSEGLHQAIEAKENLSIRQENQTLATITLQNYFKLYKKLAGMTGTAMTEAVEFFSIYNLEVVNMPTNKPVCRTDHPDVVYRTAREKYYSIVEEILEVYNQGRPILVGTTSIEKSELLSGMLLRRGIKHEVLNAKHHQREAEIVAQAGQPGRVTISTNMAGRGTDIVLGPGVAEKGGLHVVGTERHEARRIDNQLRGRCARQGDPGSSKFFLCLEDDLMRRFASERVSAILKRLGMKEGEEISHPWVTKSIERAQKKVEAYHFEIRKNLLEYDQVMNEQRRLVYTQRQDAVEGKSLRAMILGMAEKTLRRRIQAALQHEPASESENGEEKPYDPMEEISASLKADYGISLNGAALEEGSEEDQVEALVEQALKAYDQHYEERVQENGPEMMGLVERFVLLKITDDKWKDHLLAMDHLRHSIGLRGYGQIDPKMAYKQEGYQMFSEMLEGLQREVSEAVLRVRVRKEDESALGTKLDNAEYQHQAAAPGTQPPLQASAGGKPASTEPAKPIRNKGPKIGRNDACPCGSGKKYKKCCGVGKG
ncbi:MAG: preprotein translocase subunit SecA [Planctomycetes bacterium]|nr:preprotein translocase subunit SecA [Planctomycetota bacterium]